MNVSLRLIQKQAISARLYKTRRSDSARFDKILFRCISIRGSLSFRL